MATDLHVQKKICLCPVVPLTSNILPELCVNSAACVNTAKSAL